MSTVCAKSSADAKWVVFVNLDPLGVAANSNVALIVGKLSEAVPSSTNESRTSNRNGSSIVRNSQALLITWPVGPVMW